VTRRTLRLARLTFAFAFAFASALTASLPTFTPTSSGSALAAEGQGVHVRIRGATRIEAHAARALGRIVISGTVTDDGGRPATAHGGSPDERVNLGFELATDLHPPMQPGGHAGAGGTVNLSGAAPETCTPTGGGPGTGAPPTLVGPDRLGVAVDTAGRFCVKLSLSPGRYVAHLEWPPQAPPSGFLDGSRLDWPLDLTFPQVSLLSLAFDPEPSSLSLDDAVPEQEVVASVEEDGVTRGVPGLRIVLSNESGDTLGEATTATSGRAKFRVEPARLGKVGRGELRATFGGDASTGAGACWAAVERRSHVDLSIPDATGDVGGLRLPVASPEDGIPVRVVASPRCASAGCTGLPTGTVEARVGDAVVGAATLEHGSALLLVTFARPATAEVPLRVRYLPDAPWFLTSDERVALQPLQRPSPWRTLPLGLAGLAVLGWLAAARVAAWWSPERAAKRPPKPTGRVEARVELIEALPDREGWRGRVVDAHEDCPLADARVAIERPGFERVEVVAEVRSGDDGRFALPAVDPRPGDELVSEAALHAPLRGPLPPSADLRVALVLRRRAVLDRLVAWARRKGKPFDVRPEPTPAHVRRAAGADSPVGKWADAVERAAYGGDPVDARAQADLESLAPPAAEPADPSGRPRPR
jgi:hypothetical protein